MKILWITYLKMESLQQQFWKPESLINYPIKVWIIFPLTKSGCVTWLLSEFEDMTLNYWPWRRKIVLCPYKARLTESPFGHSNGGSYWFLSIRNVILIQNDLQWCVCISTYTLKPWTKWKVTSIAGCREHTLEEEGPSSGTKQNRAQNYHKLWLGTVTGNERESGVFTGKLKIRLSMDAFSGWHGLHWSFSMMHPVTFGGCLGFFLML